MTIDVEKLAVSAVRDFCVFNPYLDPQLNENDRSLIWDGFINIFGRSDNNRKVEEFVGRVPVQIKGKMISTFQLRDSIKYSVEISHIKAYLSGDGCFYFVVVISNVNKIISRHIFYHAFYQREMGFLLDKYRHQKTQTIEFQKFPVDHTEQANLLLNYCKTYKEGASFARVDMILPESQRNKIKNFKINYASVKGDSDNTLPPFHFLTKGTHNLFGSFDDGSPYFAFDQVSNITMSPHETYSFGAGTTIFFDQARIIWQDGNLIYQVNPVFRMTVYFDGSGSIDFSVKPLHQLSEHIRVAEFIQELNSSKTLLINDRSIDLSSQLNVELAEYQQFVSYSEWIISIKNKLDSLGVYKDLILPEGDNKNWNQLDLLLHIDGEALQNYSAENQVTYINVGNLRILVEARSKSDGLYIRNFFSKEEMGQYACQVGEDENKYIASRFLLLDIDAIKADNFCADVIFDDVEKHEIYPQLLGNYNQLGLESLRAYDETKDISKLNLARRLFEYLKAKYPQKENDFLKINYYQSILREEGSISEHVIEINRIMLDHPKNHEMLMCCNILLSDFAEAKINLDKIDSESKVDVWPIMNLMPSDA